MYSAQDYLLLALAQAHSRRGFCAPNPAVGAVIVKNGEIIAEAAHQGAGTAHAEANALKIVGEAARGSTLYVTLEPCNHQGRTPPCTEAIIQQGIQHVYYAYADPNTTVKGKGAEALRQAGVQVSHISVPEIDEFYRSYTYWLKTQMPFLTVKLALSLDGKIAASGGKPVKLTGSEAQDYTHQARCQSDALLTSVRTIINDDPQLNVRLANKTIAKPLYILDQRAELPLSAHIFKTAESITIFHDSTVPTESLNKLKKQGVDCVLVSSSRDRLSGQEILKIIGQKGVHDLWLEAGGKLFEFFYEAELIQKILFYFSPTILGKDAYPAFRQVHHFAKNAKIHWFQLGEEGACEILLSGD